MKTATKLSVLTACIPLLLWTLSSNVCRFRHQGKLTACRSNLKNLSVGLEMYSTDFSGHYPRNLNLLTPNYLKTLPICPAANGFTYRADFGPNAPHNSTQFVDYYFLECTGHNHKSVGLSPDQPQADSVPWCCVER